MAKAKRLVLTNEWVEIKEMFEEGTNGCDDYGKNFIHVRWEGESRALALSFLHRGEVS